MGEIIARIMLRWLYFLMKFVIVASSWLFILLYQWCTVTQTPNLLWQYEYVTVFVKQFCDAVGELSHFADEIT